MTAAGQHIVRPATVLPDPFWQDDRVSLEAKGAFVYLLSRPADYNISLPDVGETLHIGAQKTKRIFKELLTGGYVAPRHPRLRKGAFKGYYVISEQYAQRGEAS